MRGQCTIIANRHLIKFLHHGTLKSLRFKHSDVSVKVLRQMGIHEIIIITRMRGSAIRSVRSQW